MERKNSFIEGFEKQAFMKGFMQATRMPSNKARTALGMGLVGAAIPTAALFKGFDKLVDPKGVGDVKGEW